MDAPTLSAIPAATAPPAPAARRAHALDALRGLAILMMVLSGVVPSQLPAWMHHAQTPPPTKAFDPSVPGITWVDLVFPFFLFALGAAIPLALSRRLDRGASVWRVVLGTLQRFLLLGLFGVYVAQIRPFAVSSYPLGPGDWVRGLVAFALLFPILMRLPERWPKWQYYGVRVAGWLGAAALMWTLRLPDGVGFSLGRSDIIIMILANVMVGATLVWLLTRNSWLMRLGALGLLMAVRLTTATGGESWVKAIWTWKPPYLDWLWVTGYWSYLFLAIPGAIAGDMLLRWMRDGDENGAAPGWTHPRMAAVATAAFAATPLLLWGLLGRHIGVTVAGSALLSALLIALTRGPQTATERLLNGFARWGAYWLMLGLVFEPYEGGIKKDPATMSYYFVCAGLALFFLITFTVVHDVFQRRRSLALLVGAGQNPMIAYVGLSNLVQPVLFLTGINPLINRFTEGRPMAQFAHGAAATLLLAVAVYGFSRARVFWRT